MTQQTIDYILSLFESANFQVSYAAIKQYGQDTFNVIVRAHNPTTGETSNYEGLLIGSVPEQVEYAINLLNNNK